MITALGRVVDCPRCKGTGKDSSSLYTYPCPDCLGLKRVHPRIVPNPDDPRYQRVAIIPQHQHVSLTPRQGI